MYLFTWPPPPSWHGTWHRIARGGVGGKRQGASAWGCTIEKMLKPNQLMLSNFHSQRSTQRLKEAPFGISGSALCCCCTTSNVTYTDDDSWWQRAQRLWAQAELRKQYAHSLFCSLTFLFFGLINDAYKCGLHWWQIKSSSRCIASKLYSNYIYTHSSGQNRFHYTNNKYAGSNYSR